MQAKRKFRLAWADLEEVGFERKQAEESIKVLAEIMETNLATKIDVLKIENNLQNFEYKLNSKIDKLQIIIESKLIIKIGTNAVAGFGFTIGILGFLIRS